MVTKIITIYICISSVTLTTRLTDSWCPVSKVRLRHFGGVRMMHGKRAHNVVMSSSKVLVVVSKKTKRTKRTPHKIDTIAKHFESQNIYCGSCYFYLLQAHEIF